MPDSPDVVVIGAGHNGLTAAAYLARAGLEVLVLERGEHPGGAAVSARPFPGFDARLSRYSYLVSLLPQRIVDELGLDLDLVRRRVSSYTPDPADPSRGLLIERADADLAAAFARIDAADDAPAWSAFSAATARLAEAVFPTMTEPLPSRSELRARLGDDALWDELVERPLGESIRSRFASDLVRGVVATDGLIGTFASVDDATLDANRCFLYHVIGGGTGDWDVPVGGMGRVTDELARAARAAGATIVTGAEVLAATPAGGIRYRHEGELIELGDDPARRILANVAPFALERLLAAGEAGGRTGDDAADAGTPTTRRTARVRRPEGAQVKVNLLLTRLPRLRDATVAPEDAFAGTFHINERLSQLERGVERAASGEIPKPLPCEIYCHTLSDPSILGPELRGAGMHTLTVFGLHTPDRLVDAYGDDALRDALEAAALASLDSVLAEPIDGVIARDAAGRRCIETKTTRDLERALGMPGGNIFHGPLTWPFAEDAEPRATAAERWGVATRHPGVLLCGSGARRGGAVSGVGGHNAAMAVLEERGIRPA